MINKVQNLPQLLLIVMTFGIGIALAIMPLPPAGEWFRPAWVLLILIYWLKTLPRSVGLLVAWGLGFWVDSIQGVVVGQYPLIFLIIALLVNMTRNVSHHFSRFQQILWMSVMVGIAQGMGMVIEKIVNGVSSPLWALSSGVASILAWPFVFALLRKCYRLGWGPRLG